MKLSAYLNELSYVLLKQYRYRFVRRLLDKNSKTLLDIGCRDLFFYNRLKQMYDITLADIEPKYKLIKKENVENLSFKDNSFDIVLCQQVLEHVYDPVKAIKELKRAARKQLVISVPYEPFFSILRFFIWKKEHVWAIRPEVFKHHLGKPAYEKKIFFKRYYVGIWKK